MAQDFRRSNIKEIIQMAKNVTDILLPKEFNLNIITSEGESRTFTFTTFCFSKTIRALQLLTAILKVEDVTDLFGMKEGQEIAQKLAEILPALITELSPVITELAGLIVLSNSELRQLEKNGGLRAKLQENGDEILYAENGSEVLIKVITLAVLAIGLDSIKKELPKILAAVRSRIN